ncbi:MAG: YbhN family protein [Coprococcus sp.]
MNKNKLGWSLFFIVLAALSIWAVCAQSADFSPAAFIESIRQASLPWLLLAALCMTGFILFEGLAVISISRRLGYPAGVHRGILYSSADIYFSAITPSASGGQPACAFFMIKDGIPGAVTTVTLLINLILYITATFITGIMGIAINPALISKFGIISRALIIIGCIVQFLLITAFFLLLKKDEWIEAIGNKLLLFLSHIHLVKQLDKRQSQLKILVAEYRQCSAMAAGHTRTLIPAFIFNLLQRICQISVCTATYLATGGSMQHAADIWGIQSFVVLGSNSVPIPGAIGVADYLLLDGLQGFMSKEAAVHLELLSRSISFYCCILLSGLIALLGYFLLILKNKKKNEEGKR